MAEEEYENASLIKNPELVSEITNLLWGSSVKQDIFQRWSQGFYFSQYEPTALEQAEGGPCAVIAPVQAFIVKQLLNENLDITDWKKIKSKTCDELLVKAMVDIIEQAVDQNNKIYSVIHFLKPSNTVINGEVPVNETSTSAEETSTNVQSSSSSLNVATVDSKFFHSHLRIQALDNIADVEKVFHERVSCYKKEFGVLLLLYSVISTKGLCKVRSEVSDLNDPLIDSTYGYGSQSLINLMLTGRAVSHVWDHDQNVGGLTLRGIDRQNSIGFLALLECLRYCEVGFFLKSPSYPIWLLGSETHLTVLFSQEKKLVNLETPAEQAKRVFKKYDPEGNNFISTNLLQDVLAELGLVSDEEYVEIIKKKLDSESLGIILLNAFMDEFFPEEPTACPDTFILYHYNGLFRSNPNNKVVYRKGQAVLLECTVKCILDSNPMLTVLQTKWPSIDVVWEDNVTPSLN